MVIIDANVGEEDAALVGEFMDFLWGAEAQEAMAKNHFRVVDQTVFQRHAADFQKVDSPFTIDDLGGWDEASVQVIEGAWREAQRD